MNIEDIKEGCRVRNIKHNVIEEITGIGKIKTETGWIDAVFYKGIDRFTGKEMYFGKAIDEFLADFEIVSFI